MHFLYLFVNAISIIARKRGIFLSFNFPFLRFAYFHNASFEATGGAPLKSFGHRSHVKSSF